MERHISPTTQGRPSAPATLAQIANAAQSTRASRCTIVVPQTRGHAKFALFTTSAPTTLDECAALLTPHAYHLVTDQTLACAADLQQQMVCTMTPWGIRRLLYRPMLHFHTTLQAVVATPQHAVPRRAMDQLSLQMPITDRGLLRTRLP